ncbi:MAG: RNA-binding protein [Nitrospira sp.]|nr:RNA-binding protein [Nitrospira sp.]
MGSKLYVGGLPYSVTEQQLTDTFGAHGTVASAKIIADKFTGQSRGFGFVEMSSDAEAQAAITALHGSDMGAARSRSMKRNQWNHVPVAAGDSVVVEVESAIAGKLRR